jgi:pimeloyl-ACP methyl ester carboxylesterase
VARVGHQLRDLAETALLRPGPDPEYADGDDASWSDLDWPALTRTVEIQGRSVNLVDTGGDGPALLFLHGLGGLWQNWLLNIPAFTDRYRVIAPDLPGFGRSDLPGEPISIKGYARTIELLCDELGVRDVVVVGNSMGGFIGAELAISFPTRVHRLVLVSAAGLSTEYHRKEPLLTLARMWTLAAGHGISRAEAIVRRRRLRRAFLAAIVRYPEKLSPALTWELVQGAGKPGFLPALAALLSYSVRDRLPEIEIPVLIVWGRNDLLVPVADSADYERLIGPNARRVVFEDTGHVSMLERPTRFNRLLTEFLVGDEAPGEVVEGVTPQPRAAVGGGATVDESGAGGSSPGRVGRRFTPRA